MNDEIGMACSTRKIITTHSRNRMMHYPVRNNEIIREWVKVQTIGYINVLNTGEQTSLENKIWKYKSVWIVTDKHQL